MQLQVKTLLNQVHPLKGFVYDDVRLVQVEGKVAPWVEATVRGRKGSVEGRSDSSSPGR